MIRNTICALAISGAFLAQPALAAPGVGENVYGAKIYPGEVEIEARYGQLNGGSADGEDGLVLELAHAFSKHFYGAALVEFEREPGQKRRLEAIAFEGITPLGRINALKLDTAVYAEYEIVRGGHDKVEFKALLQHQSGAFDGRFNLKVNKVLGTKDPLELGYAASADWKIVDQFRLGAAAFGDLGTTRNFAPRSAHFIGPIAKNKFENLVGDSGLRMEAGYLFPLGAARDETKGQLRFILEWETHF
jgi:hypothetical protein